MKLYAKSGRYIQGLATFDEVKAIVDKIPKEEHKYFYTGENFTDSPYVIYRNVKYILKNNTKYGAFVEVYSDMDSDQPDEDIGYITVVAEPEARGTGITDTLVKDAISNMEAMQIHSLYWECDADNKGSVKLAERTGFKLDKKYSTHDYVVYVYNI